MWLALLLSLAWGSTADEVAARVEVAVEAGDVDGAIAALEELVTLDALPAGASRPERYNQLGSFLQEVGRFSEAEEAFERVLELLGDEKPVDRAQAHVQIARGLTAQGHHNQALERMERAMGLAEGFQHPIDAASMRTIYAWMLKNAGQLDHALAEVQAALTSLEAMEPDTLQDALSQAYTQLGDIRRRRGERREAREAYELALARTAGTVSTPALDARNALAIMVAEDGDLEQALTLMLEVQRLQDQVGASENNHITALANLTAIYLGLDQLEPAAATLEQTLARVASLDGVQELRINLLEQLAMVRSKQGDPQRARSVGEEALQLRIELLGAEHPSLATTHYNLGKFAYRAQDLEQAERHFLAGLAVLEGKVDGAHLDRLDLLRVLAQLQVSLERPDDSLATLTELFEGQERLFRKHMAFGSPRQKRLFVESASGGMGVLLTSCLTNPSTQCETLAATAVLRHKGRVSELEHDGLARLHGDPAGEEALSALQTAIDDWEKLRGTEQATAARQQVEQQQDAVLRRAQQLGSPSEVHLETVRAAIPRRALLVELVRFEQLTAPIEEHYAALVLGRDQLVWLDLGPAAPIDDAVNRLRRRVDTRLELHSEDYKGLSATLLSPLLPHLSRARHVLWAPDGALSLLPAELLWHGQFRPPELSMLLSGRDLLRLDAPAPRGGPPRLLVDPVFAESPRLPGTAAEGEALVAMLPKAELLSQEKATPEALRATPAPKLLHIATHGRFEAEGGAEAAMMRSGLELAGPHPFVSAAELSTLDLRATELVVLSACETAVGEVQAGEGVAGLRRGLVLAGTHTQVLSLWRVDDQATKELMVQFYRHLLAGKPRAKALRLAKEHVRRTPGWEAPWFWAGFVLSGDWRALP